MQEFAENVSHLLTSTNSELDNKITSRSYTEQFVPN